jgi:RNA polymerase sigma-70 factor (ECF subfamily)
MATWIYRIATNAAFDRLRARSTRRAGETLLQIRRPPTDRGADVERALVRREMNDCIRQYVDELSPSYRSVVLLSEDEGLSNAEIAEALGVSLETVKIRLHRARARLRTRLGSDCTVYRDDRNELACEPRPRGVSPGR